MNKVGLIVVERINSLTLKRAALLSELERRKNQKPHARVGAWRHEFHLEALKSKVALLERQRLLLLQKHASPAN